MRRQQDKKKRTPSPTSLPVVKPMVAGLDVGSTEHWVCWSRESDKTPDVRVFGTTDEPLNELAEWLLDRGVKSVAMESTSVYWIPIYELLESKGLEVVLVNARQFRNVPGRPKTDFRDCQWLQLLPAVDFLMDPSDLVMRHPAENTPTSGHEPRR